MKAVEFVELVKQMRSRQKDYFQSRDGAALSESKELERRVDAAIRDMQDNQRKLF